MMNKDRRKRSKKAVQNKKHKNRRHQNLRQLRNQVKMRRDKKLHRINKNN